MPGMPPIPHKSLRIPYREHTHTSYGERERDNVRYATDTATISLFTALPDIAFVLVK
jgi:hypothetical protein